MNLLLTMAGLYTRFHSEGIKFPKYLLPWGSRCVLSKILFELTKDYRFNGVFLVGNERDKNYANHVLAILNSFGLSHKNILYIADTDGQAATASIAIDQFQELSSMDQPLLIHNIDTILLSRNIRAIEKELAEADGYIDIFNSSNHSYSYVLKTENNLLLEISEKKVISNLATSGCYGFCNSEFYIKYFEPKKTTYISDVYRHALLEKKSIKIGQPYAEQDTIVLGTPSEYIQSTKSLPLSKFQYSD